MRPATIVTALLMLGSAAAASAQQPAPAFIAGPVAEATLADTNAARPGPRRDQDIVRSDMVDADERGFSRQLGSIGQVTFDNWFAEVGVALIAANLR